MTEPLEVLVYDVMPIDQGHETFFVARSYPSQRIIFFEATRYDDVHMMFLGSKVYQLKRQYWPKEEQP